MAMMKFDKARTFSLFLPFSGLECWSRVLVGEAKETELTPSRLPLASLRQSTDTSSSSKRAVYNPPRPLLSPSSSLLNPTKSKSPNKNGDNHERNRGCRGGGWVGEQGRQVKGEEYRREREGTGQAVDFGALPANDFAERERERGGVGGAFSLLVKGRGHAGNGVTHTICNISQAELNRLHFHLL